MTEQQTKIKKSVAKRSARDASLEASRKNGESLAVLREVPTSPRKMRLVADLIRGQQVSYALNVLKHEKAHPSIRLEKLLLSAVANWQLKYPDAKLEDAGLFVKEIYVGGGKMLKRVQPAPQGRAHRIRKRSNHVTLILGSNLEKIQVEKDQKTNQKDGAEG